MGSGAVYWDGEGLEVSRPFRGNQAFAVNQVRSEEPARPRGGGGQQVAYRNWSPWEGYEPYMKK